MTRELYPIIVSIKYYAKFLRTGKVEDAVRAVQDPRDKEQGYSQYSLEEQKKAVELCKSQTKGTIAFVRYRNFKNKIQQMKQKRKKEIQYYRNIAFTILTREGREIPQELLQDVLNDMDEKIDDFESTHKVIDDFDETEWRHNKFETALKRCTGKKVDVYKEYAENWHESLSWELLKDRHKSWRKRREKNQKNKKRIYIEEYLRKHHELKKNK